MEEQIKSYIEYLFSQVPCSDKAIQLKSETLANATRRYMALLSEGKSEQEAYAAAISEIGDIKSLLSNTSYQSVNQQQWSQQIPEQPPVSYSPSPENSEKAEKEKRKGAFITAIAVAIYIICVIPPIITESVSGVVIMFIMIAVATGLLIFKAMTKPNYIQPNVSEDSEDKYKGNSLFKAFSSVLWLLIVAAYFVVSFLTGAWYITWITFLIGGALEGVMKAIFDIATKR